MIGDDKHRLCLIAWIFCWFELLGRVSVAFLWRYKIILICRFYHCINRVYFYSYYCEEVMLNVCVLFMENIWIGNRIDELEIGCFYEIRFCFRSYFNCFCERISGLRITIHVFADDSTIWLLRLCEILGIQRLANIMVSF